MMMIEQEDVGATTPIHKLTNGNSNNGLLTNGHKAKKDDDKATYKYTYEHLAETAKYLLERVPFRPKIGIICGSGMGSLAEALTDKVVFPYNQIPHFPESTVEGHAGQLVFGYLMGVEVVCMKGRFHHYEGYPLWKCSMPVRVMKLVGISHLIATNAAGGLNPKYKVGDVMLVNDHINLMGFSGNNPLHGPNDERFGPRFLPMNRAYDKDLIELAKKVWDDLKLGPIHEGVYTCLGGPNFETVAELKMLQMVGVDAVGMSTVHEVITARHCDLTVLAFSLITNFCATNYENQSEANHEEVMDVGKMRQDTLATFVQNLVLRIKKLGYPGIK
ncbi:PREDICTED: purine nucleoside phosphorylase isoform X2 [Nicrophorus vespilloides]|uniref:Purine nucleoside phosphorylase n=1 Tax=Nicrophorus vespilloides TaxID=110193 RepID=A0ABM1MNJ7_NICVS|nr:PREDICTED: purine nucleoside phosphorylase isoform X2 [Nicrophorus vespilloides]